MNLGIIHESFMNVSVHMNVVDKTLLGCPELDTSFRTISKGTIVVDNEVFGYDQNIKEKEEEEEEDYYLFSLDLRELFTTSSLGDNAVLPKSVF